MVDLEGEEGGEDNEEAPQLGAESFDSTVRVIIVRAREMMIHVRLVSNFFSIL